MKDRNLRIRERLIRTLLTGAVASGLVVDTASARERTIAGVVYDVAIERPIGLAETLIGVAVAGAAYPIAMGAGKTSLVVERCINAPGRYTFTRGLGDFSDRPENQCSPVGFSFGLVKLSFALIERPFGLLFGGSPFSKDPPDAQGGVEVDREVPRRSSGTGTAEI